MQVGTWILLPLLVLHFLVFVSPVLPIAASAPLTVLFLTMGGLAMFYAYRCCTVDPIDPMLALHHRRQAGQAVGEGQAEAAMGDGPTKYCWVCQTNVKESSMHCKFCDKCVCSFDHHCMWLNTCIGETNYPLFFRAVAFTFAFVLVDSLCLAGVSVAYYIQRYVYGGGGVPEVWDGDGHGNGREGGVQVLRYNGWLGVGAPTVVAAFNLFFLAVAGAAACLVGQLLLFHIRLRREGITTYKYIVRDSARKREKNKELMQVRSKRIVLVRAAEGRGDRAALLVLQVGRCCPPCDPALKAVRLDARKEKEKGEEKIKDTRDIDAEGGEEGDEEAALGSSSSDEEGFANEDRGVQPTSRIAETQTEGDDAGSDERDKGPEQAKQITLLQEAMAAKELDNGTAPSAAPQFVAIGATEESTPTPALDARTTPLGSGGAKVA